MKKNMGTIDKVIRMFIAAAIAVLALTHVITGIWAIVLLIAAIVFLITAFVGFCPLYRLFGWSSCKVKH